LPRRTTPRARKKKKYVISEKQRAEDERLREQLRHADLKEFEKVLVRAIRPPPRN
jgi:hypothetical protein